VGASYLYFGPVVAFIRMTFPQHRTTNIR